jgi:hypothetical protein
VAPHVRGNETFAMIHATHRWIRCFSMGVSAALVAMASTLPGSAQEQPKWDPKNATPGVQLNLKEVGREKVGGVTQVTYLVTASGLQDEKTYELWLRRPGDVLRITTDSGDFNADAFKRGINVHVSEYIRGAPLRFVVTSADQAMRAFVEIYPFPIEARDGSCHLWVEIISPQGTVFAIYGDGFGGDEEVTAISRSGGEIIGRAQKVSSDGTLPVNIVTPAVVGKQSGTAAFSVAGKSCAPTVNYEWGPPALKIQ